MARILLAEDDRSLCDFLTMALAREGHEVIARTNGLDALAELESGERYDLLLSDIVMPGMDGIELSQRAMELRPSLKVMFITGFAAVSLRASREQPSAKILSKPFHLRDLVLEVERVFEEADAARI